MVIERGPKGGDWPPAVTRAILIECIILALFAITWYFLGTTRPAGLVYTLIALSAVAMGIQSAAVGVRHLTASGCCDAGSRERVDSSPVCVMPNAMIGCPH